MKRYSLAIACFLLTLAALAWLDVDNQAAVVVGSHDLEPGMVLQRSDVEMLFYGKRYRMPRGTIKCWLDCTDRVVGHKVIRTVEKYRSITLNDIN